jgi:ABC-2 type transport system ATP-binding protein
VIGHAALNGFARGAIFFLQLDASPNLLIGPLPTGVLSALPWTILAAWLLIKGAPRKPDHVSRETSPVKPLRAPKDSAIYAEDLSKDFGVVKAVQGLDLDIKHGEVFGLLGPNGAGKTTTIRMLSALIAPTRGQAQVAGFRLGEEDGALRKAVGILTETPGLYQQLSAERNLGFFAQLYEVENVDAQVKRYLQMLGLWERRADAVGTFSKGMRQKLAIARALLHEPAVLFLDEPTSGLDPETARVVREFISELRGEGRTIVLTTHNLAEADRLCDRIAVFSGRLLALDTPTNLRRTLYGRSVVFHMATVKPEYAKMLQKKAYVATAKTVDNTLVVTLDDPESRNPELVRELVGLGAEIQFVGELRQSLEDVYFQLVDKAAEKAEVHS